MNYIKLFLRLFTNKKSFALSPQFWRVLFINDEDKPNPFLTFMRPRKYKILFDYRKFLDQMRTKNELYRKYGFF